MASKKAAAVAEPIIIPNGINTPLVGFKKKCSRGGGNHFVLANTEPKDPWLCPQCNPNGKFYTVYVEIPEEDAKD